jgi:hypothetical protein
MSSLDGRLAAATLAQERVLAGRTFPRGTHVSLCGDGRLVGAVLRADGDIDGIPVKAGAPGLAFHENGCLRELRLARSHLFEGRRYDTGMLLRFDRDGQLIGAQR